MSLQMNKIRSLLKLSTEGILAVLDQGIFSGSNFILTVIFARLLSRYDFGAYTLTFSIIVVFQQIHTSILLEPVSIYSGDYKVEDIKSYLKKQLQLHFLITAGWSVLSLVILFLVTLFLESSLVLNLMFLWSLLLPFYLLIFFARRIFYIVKQPALAVGSSTIYAVFLVLALFSAYNLQLLNPVNAILTINLASLFGSLILLFWLGKVQNSIQLTRLELLKQNWGVGKWLVVSGLFTALALQSPIYLSSHFIGIEEAGVLRALQSLNQPITLTIVAVSTYSLPMISRDFTNKKYQTGKKKAFLVAGILFVVTLVFEAIFVLWHKELEFLLYDGKYSMYANLLPLLGISPIIMAVYYSFSNILLSAQNSRAIMGVSIIWLVTNFSVGTLLILQYGVFGAVLSILVGHFVVFLAFFAQFWKWNKQNKYG